MKLIVPKYYESFSCKGGACSDNCCIGWEIDIDEKTLSRYKSTMGEIGKKLSDNIEKSGEVSHFRMCRDGRCPFLNSENLCELFIGLGEDSLSDICREHPRYYTTVGDCTYGGVGLCCEAAAELILSEKTQHSYVVIENNSQNSKHFFYRMTDGADDEYDPIIGEAVGRLWGLIADRNSDLSIPDEDSGAVGIMCRILYLCREMDEVLGEYGISADCDTHLDISPSREGYAAFLEEFFEKWNVDRSNISLNRFSTKFVDKTDAEKHSERPASCLDGLKTNDGNTLATDGRDSLILRALNGFLDLEYLGDTLPKIIEGLKNKPAREYLPLHGNAAAYLENLVRYLFDRYFIVSGIDGDPIGKLSVIVSCSLLLCLLLSDLLSGKNVHLDIFNDKNAKNDNNYLHILDKTQDFEFDRVVKLAVLFSKEIEYNEDNIETLSSLFDFEMAAEAIALIRSLLK